jgi:voltage-gated potassium channel
MTATMTTVRRAAGWVSDRFRQAAIVSFLVLIVAPILMYFAEKSHNPGIDNLWSAYIWLGRVLIEGDSPYRMNTPLGFTAFYIVRLAGYGLVAFATGAITSKIVQIVVFRGAGMGTFKKAGHIVICGWNSQAREIVRELLGEELEEKRPIVILAQLPNDPYPGENQVTFVKGSPSSAEDLKRAGIERAECAIVIADASAATNDPDDMDARTLVTVLAIESLNPDCYTCVEVVKSENRPHFDRAKADEMVVSAEMTGALLASSAKTHGLSRIVTNLLTHPEDMEFYREPVPPELVGKSIQEVVGLIKSRYDALLVGMFPLGGAPIVNPRGNIVLAEGDALLVVAAHPLVFDSPVVR